LCDVKAKTDAIKTRIITQARVGFVLVGLLAGCEKKEQYDLVNAGNGLVYRINKSSGEVTLIVGSQLTKLDESRGSTKEEPKKSYLANWAAQTLSHLGDITVKVKTTWREGKLLYILEASPYAGRLATARENRTSNARFNLNFCDADGFVVLTIPAILSEMTRTVDENGKPSGLRMNSSIPCSVEACEAMKVLSVGWADFSE
jgi:hypothetical protein